VNGGRHGVGERDRRQGWCERWIIRKWLLTWLGQRFLAWLGWWPLTRLSWRFITGHWWWLLARLSWSFRPDSG